MSTQTLTVLLADLVGSSTHLTAIPQKQAVEYLQDATAPIRELIESHEGTIIKFVGDGYLATFESVAQALRAADKIQHHFMRQKHTPSGISLDGVRVIVNTADVTLENSDVIGDGVAIISRLEKDVPTNQVYVTRAVHAIADDAEFAFESVGEMRPRGWHKPVKVYQLLSTEASFVDHNIFLLITDLHGLINAGENLSAGSINQWLLTWGDMHRQAVIGLKGRVRQFIADMALITFTNADDAVQGVISLRALAAIYNQTRPNLPPIHFAAALAKGDIILSPTGVVGQLVTQTMRLLKISPNNTITIDQTIYDQLHDYQNHFRSVMRTTDEGESLVVYELIESDLPALP